MWRALLVVALSAGHVSAQPLPDQTDRMIGAATLWAKAKFFHPYLGYQDIDWDAALIRAIPKIERATTIDQYRAALAEMLGALGDPATRIVAPRPEPTPVPVTTATSWPTPDVLFVDLAKVTSAGWDTAAISKAADEIEKEAAKAKVLVVDLRSLQVPWIVQNTVGYFAKILPAIDVWPSQRVLEHRGFRTQDSGSSLYFSTFITSGGSPPKPAPPAGPTHVIFIADPQTLLPLEAIALQGNGHGMIVATGSLDASANVETSRVELPGGLVADVRLGESQWGAPKADVTVPANQDPRARAIELAKLAITQPKRLPRMFSIPRKPLALPDLRVRDDKDYVEQPFPSRELRILAGIRAWAVLEYFFPYRYMIDDWEKVLRDSLPRLAAAADREAYVGVLREMAARTNDGHVGISPGTRDQPQKGIVKPRGLPGVQVRLVENKVVVVRLLDEPAKAVAIGEVVETIDGRAIATLLDEKRPQVSGSTVESREQRNAAGLFYGESGTTVKLGVRDAKGNLRDVTLTRTAANAKAVWDGPVSAHWKKLANNIGYVDMQQLTLTEVGPALDEFKAARAIIFDMRGYPNGTAWSIAPRLNVKKAKYGAELLMPIVGPISENAGETRVRYLQPIPPLPAGASLYQGKVIVLIDDRAISQAEHTCLFLSSAANVTFVGSPTHGANGDITTMRLPGGLRLTFTGQEVRWPDGRQLQRVGVKPDIVVRPTIAGIRAGKDEVLDRALAFIEKGK